MIDWQIMDNTKIFELLQHFLKNKSVDITVKGNSMFPTFHEGDVITISKHDDYEIGDVVVFRYKNNELLVHRLLKKTSRYFCKGDNSFRLEDIDLSNIMGKVNAVNGIELNAWPVWKINLSFIINRIFFKSRYNINKVKETAEYKAYEDLVLKKSRKENIYSRNMDVSTKDCTLQQSDRLKKLNENILRIISSGCSYEKILWELSEIYKVDILDIENKAGECLVALILSGAINVE